MVDCELINIEKISNEERVKIINYVMEKKGVKARDLGVMLNLISTTYGLRAYKPVTKTARA